MKRMKPHLKRMHHIFRIRLNFWEYDRIFNFSMSEYYGIFRIPSFFQNTIVFSRIRSFFQEYDACWQCHVTLVVLGRWLTLATAAAAFKSGSIETHLLLWKLPKVTEASSARRGLLWSGDPLDGPIGPGFEIYLKIIYSEQLFTSYQIGSMSKKIA